MKDENVEEIERLREENAALIGCADTWVKRCRELEAEMARTEFYHTAAKALAETLRYKWDYPDVDDMTLFLAAIACGITTEWLKNTPKNGVVATTVLPEIGQVDIIVQRSVGEPINLVFKRLRRSLEMLAKRGCECAEKYSEGEGERCPACTASAALAPVQPS